MIRRPPRSTRTDPLFPYTALFRSGLVRIAGTRALPPEVPVLFQESGPHDHEIANHHSGKGLGPLGHGCQGCARPEAVRDDCRLLAIRKHIQRLGNLAKLAPSRQEVGARSEEHPSELQSLMRTSYAVFCLTKKQYQ